MHANAELIDDLIKAIILLTSTAAAVFGARNHRKVKEINQAVNGVEDPNAKTLRENVQEIHDEQVAVRKELTQTPPPGQVG